MQLCSLMCCEQQERKLSHLLARSFRSSFWLNLLVTRMPRLWAQQCRVNPAHTGPFSRNGLCPPCRHALLREAGKIGSKLGGGRPREYTCNVPRSWQPLTRRVKHASIKQKQRDTASTKERKVSRVARQKKGGQHRSCFRCRKRCDICRRYGCVPTQWSLKRGELDSFLQDFDAPGCPLRRTSDCWDVAVIRLWAIAAKHAFGMRTTLLGPIVAAHSNSVRTFGVLNQPFQH